jgi:hypothetical protein
MEFLTVIQRPAVRQRSGDFAVKTGGPGGVRPAIRR